MTSLYFYHAALNFIAIVILSVGLYYSIMKPENWFPSHRLFMIIFSILICISIFMALVIREYFDKSPINIKHSTIAFVILFLVLLQLFVAITLRKKYTEFFEVFHKINASVIILLLLLQSYIGYYIIKNKKI